MEIEVKFLDTKKNIYSDNASHMVRHIGAWGNMTQYEFLRVLEAAYELESMHSDNWESFIDASGEEIKRRIEKGIKHLTIVFIYWHLPDELKKTYIGIYDFFCKNTIEAQEKTPEMKIEFKETLVFPIESKDEIIKMAKESNFEFFLKAAGM